MWMPLGAWRNACVPKGIHIPKAKETHIASLLLLFLFAKVQLFYEISKKNKKILE